jgi:hypothetical protein
MAKLSVLSIFLLLSVLALPLIWGKGKVSYKGYKVFRLTPSTEYHVELIQQLGDQGVSQLYKAFYEDEV